MDWTPPHDDTPWPDAEQRLLLSGALHRGELGRSARRQWLALTGGRPRDYRALELLPLLSRRLSDGEAGPEALRRLESAYRWSWSRNHLLFHGVARVLSALAGAGIRTLLLKGAALALTAYRDPGTRVMGDVDVLVDPERVDDALAILADLGWQRSPEIGPDWRRGKHAAPFLDDAGRQIDLHQRPLPEALPADATEAIWRTAVELDFHGAATHTLRPAEHLVHSILHGLAPASGQHASWIADAWVQIEAVGDAFPWDEVVETAQNWRFVVPVRSVLRRLSSEMAFPVPPQTLRRLECLRVARSERLEDWFRRHNGPRYPWGRLGLYASWYGRTCALKGSLPTPWGLARHVAAQRSRPSGSSLVIDALLWPARQLYWWNRSQRAPAPRGSETIIRDPGGTLT